MTETLQAAALVQDMFDAANRGDFDDVIARLGEDVVWHNVGMPREHDTR